MPNQPASSEGVVHLGSNDRLEAIMIVILVNQIFVRVA
jgi:hypothetical protein